MARSKNVDEDSDDPRVALEQLIRGALDIGKKARKHRKSLSGDNFYGNKLAQLRATATNLFTDLSYSSLGAASALAELLETVFSSDSDRSERLTAARELSFKLRTSITRPSSKRSSPGSELFPLSLITKANRGYLTTIAHQMNGCYREGWYDACAVMMRRLVEIAIIEAFERKGVAAKIKDANGDYVQLTELIDRTLNEPKLNLSRNAKRDLPKLKNLGHRSAHGRYFTAQLPDIQKSEDGMRVVVEELLRHATLI